MSALKSNYTYQNGVKTNYNYRLEVRLPAGIERITLPDTKNNKRLAKRLQNRANEVEQLARLYPDQRDWKYELYKSVGLEYKLSTKSVIPRILEAYKAMIDEKKNLNEINHKTESIYQYAIDYLIQSCGNKKLDELTPRDKIKLLAKFNNSNLNPTTINMYSRNIVAFLNWCLRNKFITEQPFYLKQIKVEQTGKRWIEPEEFVVICSHLDPITRAYARISYFTGLRRCELGSDPNDKQYGGLYHTIHRVDDHWQLKIRGKGGKTRFNILPEALKPEHDLMVANRLHPSTITKRFKKACLKAGINDVHFHHIRHSYGSNLTRQKKDPHFIMISMGHTNLSTTTGYVNDINLSWDRLVDDLQGSA